MKIFSGNIYFKGICIKHMLNKTCLPIRQRSTLTGPVSSFSIPDYTRVPGITLEEYAARRQKLMTLLCMESQSNLVIFPGVERRYMIDHIPYLFRQDTDMLYLSGCNETDCVLVMHSLPGSDNFRTLMFVPPLNPVKELWDGPRTGPASCAEVWGVDEGMPLTELAPILSSLECELLPRVWYHGVQPVNLQIHKALSNLSNRSESSKNFVHKLRSIKSPAEIELMRETCRISSESFAVAMRETPSPASEHQIFATMDYNCRMRGADHLAYPPVVAGGSRANTIHYIHNKNLIKPGELVLMDAGGEYKGYTADITRTWPVNGKFSPAQKVLYEALLYIQSHVLSKCKERLSLDQLFFEMCSEMGKVLQDIGLLPQNLTRQEASRASFGFCPHHVSHLLGMDVHDTALLSKKENLQPGNVITNEPGIYISEGNASVPEEFRGIGMRIEDNILITETGYENFTEDCPKEIKDIENIVGSSL